MSVLYYQHAAMLELVGYPATITGINEDGSVALAVVSPGGPMWFHSVLFSEVPKYSYWSFFEKE
jgi:hypothetical protein